MSLLGRRQRPLGAPWGEPDNYDRAERGDHVDKLRDDMDQIPGVIAAQRRMVKNHHRVFPAFESLDIFTKEAAYEYLAGQMNAIKVPEDQRGRLFGVLLAFGITCVEADRELNGGDRMT